MFSNSTSNNNSNSTVDVDAANLHEHFELPGNIVLPSWLPYDPRLRFLLVSVAAPFCISCIGLLGVGSNLGFWWFICFLIGLFLFVLGAALLSGYYAFETYEIISFTTRIICMSVGLPIFVILFVMIYIHFWRARRREYAKQQELMQEVIAEIEQRQAATAKIASIVDREQLSLNALATQLARQRRREWRMHHYRCTQVILQCIFVIVLLILSLILLNVISLGPSLTQLQHTLVFRGVGVVCLLVMLLCLVWLLCYFSLRGRQLIHLVSNYMSNNFIGLVMFGLSFLYTTMVVNFVTVMYCAQLTCGPSSLPHTTESVFPISEWDSNVTHAFDHVHVNNYITTTNTITTTSLSLSTIAEANCVRVNYYEYAQACHSNWLHNLTNRSVHTKNLVYDEDVACSCTRGLFRAGSALIFASYICLLPWFQYLIARYTVHILKDEYPLERRYVEAFQEEELYYQRIRSSNNPGQAVFRAYKPSFRYYSFTFMLQKIVLAIVSCTSRKGMSTRMIWFPYVCFTLVPFAAATASCYLKPFARPTERIFFPTIQWMVSLMALFGLINYCVDVNRIPFFFGVLMAVAAIFVPLVLLIWGTICSLQMERTWMLKLRERLHERFAESLRKKSSSSSNKHKISTSTNSNTNLTRNEQMTIMTKVEHLQSTPFLRNNAFTQRKSNFFTLLHLKEQLTTIKTKMTHMLRIVLNAPELFRHNHSTNTSTSKSNNNNDSTCVSSGNNKRELNKGSLPDHIRRLSFVTIVEEDSTEHHNIDLTNTFTPNMQSSYSNPITNSHEENNKTTSRDVKRSSNVSTTIITSTNIDDNNNINSKINSNNEEEVHPEYQYRSYCFVPSSYFTPVCYPCVITSNSHFHERQTNRLYDANKEMESSNINDGSSYYDKDGNTQIRAENLELFNSNATLQENAYAFPTEHKSSWAASSSNNNNNNSNSSNTNIQEIKPTGMHKMLKKFTRYVEFMRHECKQLMEKIYITLSSSCKNVMNVIKRELFISNSQGTVNRIGVQRILTFADVYTWRRSAKSHLPKQIRSQEKNNNNNNNSYYFELPCNNTSDYKNNSYVKKMAKEKQEWHPFWYEKAELLVKQLQEQAVKNNSNHKWFRKSSTSINVYKQEVDENSNKNNKCTAWQVEYLPITLKQRAPRPPSLLPHGQLSVLCETQTLIGKEHDKLMKLLLLCQTTPESQYLPEQEPEPEEEEEQIEATANSKTLPRASFDKQKENLTLESEKNNIINNINGNIYQMESVPIIEFDFDLNAKHVTRYVEDGTLACCITAAQDRLNELHQWCDENECTFPICKELNYKEKKRRNVESTSEHAMRKTEHNCQLRCNNKKCKSERVECNKSHKDNTCYNNSCNNAKKENLSEWIKREDSGVNPLCTSKQIYNQQVEYKNNAETDALTLQQLSLKLSTSTSFSSLPPLSSPIETSIWQDNNVNSASETSSCSSFATSTGYYASGIDSYYTSDLMKCLVGVNTQKINKYKRKVDNNNNNNSHSVPLNASDNLGNTPQQTYSNNLQTKATNTYNVFEQKRITSKAETSNDINNKKRNYFTRNKYTSNPLTCEMSFLSQTKSLETTSVIIEKEGNLFTGETNTWTNNNSNINNIITFTDEKTDRKNDSTSLIQASRRFIPPSRFKSHKSHNQLARVTNILFNLNSSDSENTDETEMTYNNKNMINRRDKNQHVDEEVEVEDDDDDDVNLIELMHELHMKNSTSNISRTTTHAVNKTWKHKIKEENSMPALPEKNTTNCTLASNNTKAKCEDDLKWQDSSCTMNDISISTTSNKIEEEEQEEEQELQEGNIEIEQTNSAKCFDLSCRNSITSSSKISINDNAPFNKFVDVLNVSTLYSDNNTSQESTRYKCTRATLTATRQRGRKEISMQRLRYHCVLQEELLHSFWDNQAQLRSVQHAIDKKIYHTLRRMIQMYLFLLGCIAAIALALTLSGVIKNLHVNSFISGQRYTFTTVSYELAHYTSWEEFTNHCCCVAVTNLNGDLPPFYAVDAENWVCENGYTKQRIRRDRLNRYERKYESHKEHKNLSLESLEWERQKKSKLIANITKIYSDNDDNSKNDIDGYVVRTLCGMKFTPGCELVFTRHKRANVVSIKCNDSSITNEELKR